MTPFFVGQAGTLRRTGSPPASGLHTIDSPASSVPGKVVSATDPTSPPARPIRNRPQAASLPHKHHATRGFTLLEMIVATLIMSIAVVGLLTGISGAVRNAARVREYDRVVQLARLRMNDLVSAPAVIATSEHFNPDLTGGVDAGWQAQITPFIVPPGSSPVKVGLDRILLQVWWMSGDQRRTFTLEGFREHIYNPNPAGSAP